MHETHIYTFSYLFLTFLSLFALLLQSPCLKNLRFRFCVQFCLRFWRCLLLLRRLCLLRRRFLRRRFRSNLLLNGCLNVRLNLCHQRRNGDERSAQCLGFQDAFQFVDLGAVDARVLRRREWFAGFVRSSHPYGFGFAAIDFLVDCGQECEFVLRRGCILGLGLAADLALHDTQLRIRGRRENFNGNLHLQHRIGIGIPGPLGVRGWTVSGTGVGTGVGTGKRL